MPVSVLLPMHVSRPRARRVSRSITRESPVGRNWPNRIRRESARVAAIVFFHGSLCFDTCGGIGAAAENQGGLVFDNPFNDLTAKKLAGLRERRREVDVPLLTAFTIDELDLGWKAHRASCI